MALIRTLLVTVALALGVTAPAHAIVGGNDASRGEYPFIAFISIDRAFACTGSLVTPTHVVTAAHCGSIAPGGQANVPIGQPGQLIEVSIGAYEQPTIWLDAGLESDGQQFVAKSVSVNPGWLGLGSVSHDVAVIELPSPASAPPVKIASAAERSIWLPGTQATIAGFGVTDADSQESPDVLQEGRVPIRTDEDAAEAYPYLIDGVDPLFGGFEPETQLAAGVGGTDTCQGDSGGPLLAPSGTGFRLVGDTSYGVGCGDPEFPGVYGRVADTTLRTWIESVAPGSVSTGSSTSTGGTGTVKTKGPKGGGKPQAGSSSGSGGGGQRAYK